MTKMNKKKITLEVSEEKLNALTVFLEQRETTVEIELEETFDKMFERFVPKQVKHFLVESSKIE